MPQVLINIQKDSEVLASDPFYSESNMNHLRKSIQQLNEGKVVIKTMEEPEKMANE